MIVVLTYNPDLQSPASHGHDLITCKVLTSKVSRFKRFLKIHKNPLVSNVATEKKVKVTRHSLNDMRWWQKRSVRVNDHFKVVRWNKRRSVKIMEYNVKVTRWRWTTWPNTGFLLVFYKNWLWHCWLSGRKVIRPVKNMEWWGAGVVICLRGANDLDMVQLMPLPPHRLLLQQNPEWFILLVSAYPDCPEKRPLNVCVCVCACAIKTAGLECTNFEQEQCDRQT